MAESIFDSPVSDAGDRNTFHRPASRPHFLVTSSGLGRSLALSLAAGTTRVARSAPVGSVGWLARRHRRSSAPEPGLGLTNARLGRRRDRALLPIPRGDGGRRAAVARVQRVEHAVGRADAAASATRCHRGWVRTDTRASGCRRTCAPDATMHILFPSSTKEQARIHDSTNEKVARARLHAHYCLLIRKSTVGPRRGRIFEKCSPLQKASRRMSDDER